MILKRSIAGAMLSFPSMLSGKMPISDKHLHLDKTCRRIADGRRLARLLASEVREYAMSEAEFRLLWLLRETAQASLEQSELVKGLGISSAQVSALVEKLRAQQIIAPDTDEKDRRRKLWQLTASGREWFESVIETVELHVFPAAIDISSRSFREDAA